LSLIIITHMKVAKKILIIEDDSDFRYIVATSLRSQKYIILEAKNGQEGVDVALSAHPDLILLDLLMPIMDGMTALKKIRENEWGASVPVIILTNLNATEENIVEDMITHKPLKYLIKSDWKANNLIRAIEDVLGK